MEFIFNYVYCGAGVVLLSNWPKHFSYTVYIKMVLYILEAERLFRDEPQHLGGVLRQSSSEGFSPPSCLTVHHPDDWATAVTQACSY